MTSRAPRQLILWILPASLALASCVVAPAGGEDPASPTEPAPEAADPDGAADGADGAEGAVAVEPGAEGAGEGEAAAPEAEDAPKGATGRRALVEEAGRVLDDWHQAASVGARDRYLGHFSPDAVFLGTDPDERWDLAEFTAYVDRYFRPGSGWTFTASDRHVIVGPNSEIAWFDERLASEKYGSLRGSGALRRVGESWKIAQYSMTFTIANDARPYIDEALAEFEAATSR